MPESAWNPWIVLGLAGQVAFASRMLVQWIASEREGRIIVPVVFWWLSLVGAGFLLVYAIHLADPVFVLGQSTGALVYTRNLMLRSRDAAIST